MPCAFGATVANFHATLGESSGERAYYILSDGACSSERAGQIIRGQWAIENGLHHVLDVLALDGKKFEYNTNARLLEALELKLFEDQRDTIKLKNLVSSAVDDETRQKIDVVKQRLIKYFGYNETSATVVLNYVASIFARGDSKQEEG